MRTLKQILCSHSATMSEQVKGTLPNRVELTITTKHRCERCKLNLPKRKAKQ